MSAYSLDYATRIFVDGEAVLDVGTVSEEASGFEPRIQNYLLPVMPKGNEVEIILQYANFVHRDGGAMRDIAFSTYDNMQRYAYIRILPTVVLSGGLLLIALFYLVQCSLQPQGVLAVFSLCCFLFAIRSQPLVLSVLPADYDWYLLYRILIIGSSIICLIFLLLSHLIYPARFKKWPLIATFAAVGIIDVIILLGPVAMAANLIPVAVILSIPALIYYTIVLSIQFFRGSVPDKLAVGGSLVFLVSYMVEITLNRSLPQITRIGLSPAGMLIFALCTMLSLRLKDSEQAVKLERARAQVENLDLLSKAKTEFLRNVSHELKTPLTVMSGYAQDSLAVLREASPDLSDITFNQQHIVTEAARLNRLVNQLLDAAAVESGRLRVEKVPLSLSRLTRQVVFTNFPKLNTENCRLELHLPEDLPNVPADSERIRQVLLNLLSNAVRHTTDGVITICLCAVENGQELSVSDTGEGMPDAVKAQVFKSYVEKTSGVSGRNGMGLYICRKIIEAHGGEIGIQSQEGKGTTVWFRLLAENGGEEDV